MSQEADNEERKPGFFTNLWDGTKSMFATTSQPEERTDEPQQEEGVPVGEREPGFFTTVWDATKEGWSKVQESMPSMPQWQRNADDEGEGWSFTKTYDDFMEKSTAAYNRTATSAQETWDDFYGGGPSNLVNDAGEGARKSLSSMYDDFYDGALVPVGKTADDTYFTLKNFFTHDLSVLINDSVAFMGKHGKGSQSRIPPVLSTIPSES